MTTVIKQGSSKHVIKKILDELYSKKRTKGLDAHKFCGGLNLKKDPLEIQKELRDEWN